MYQKTLANYQKAVHLSVKRRVFLQVAGGEQHEIYLPKKAYWQKRVQNGHNKADIIVLHVGWGKKKVVAIFHLKYLHYNSDMYDQWIHREDMSMGDENIILGIGKLIYVNNLSVCQGEIGSMSRVPSFGSREALFSWRYYGLKKSRTPGAGLDGDVRRLGRRVKESKLLGNYTLAILNFKGNELGGEKEEIESVSRSIAVLLLLQTKYLQKFTEIRNDLYPADRVPVEQVLSLWAA